MSFGRGSGPPQQPNPSAAAAANTDTDTDVNPEPARAPAPAPANAAASESGPPSLESNEHWPALDIRNYYGQRKRGGHNRGQGCAGEPNLGEGASASSSSSADPTKQPMESSGGQSGTAESTCLPDVTGQQQMESSGEQSGTAESTHLPDVTGQQRMESSGEQSGTAESTYLPDVTEQQQMESSGEQSRITEPDPAGFVPYDPFGVDILENTWWHELRAVLSRTQAPDAASQNLLETPQTMSSGGQSSGPNVDPAGFLPDDPFGLDMPGNRWWYELRAEDSGRNAAAKVAYQQQQQQHRP